MSVNAAREGQAGHAATGPAGTGPAATGHSATGHTATGRAGLAGAAWGVVESFKDVRIRWRCPRCGAYVQVRREALATGRYSIAEAWEVCTCGAEHRVLLSVSWDAGPGPTETEVSKSCREESAR